MLTNNLFIPKCQHLQSYLSFFCFSGFVFVFVQLHFFLSVRRIIFLCGETIVLTTVYTVYWCPLILVLFSCCGHMRCFQLLLLSHEILLNMVMCSSAWSNTGHMFGALWMLIICSHYKLKKDLLCLWSMAAMCCIKTSELKPLGGEIITRKGREDESCLLESLNQMQDVLLRLVPACCLFW